MKHSIKKIRYSMWLISLAIAIFFSANTNNKAEWRIEEPVSWVCDSSTNGISFTGLSFTGAPTNFCSAWDYRPIDELGNDWIWDWACDGIGGFEWDDCSARRIWTGNNIGWWSTTWDIVVQWTRIIITGSSITWSIAISGINLITVTSWTRNGILLPPTLVTWWQAAIAGEIGISSGTTILWSFQAGSTGAWLEASGWYFTIEFTVTNWFSWQIIKILRSQDGNTWTLNTPDDACILDANKLCTFRTDHLTLFTVGSIQRDNMNYINSNFRNAWPTDTHIIRALYGTWWWQTAYTQNRSGRNGSQCDLNTMTVEYLTWWTSKIPYQLVGNTIYVLNSWSYTTTGAINFSWCNALIGSGIVKISSNTWINMTFNISGRNNAIIENIIQNGWSTSWTSIVTDGIKIYTGKNITINNAIFSNNGSWGAWWEWEEEACGINIEKSIYVTISNTKIFNDSQQGILLSNSNYNILNNVQIYNNKDNWLSLSFSNNNIINNVQSYNNDVRWISLDNSDNNIFNNIEAYNNTDYGMVLDNSSNNNVINNFLWYNNGSYGITTDPTTSTGNKYFWILSSFGNVNNTIGSLLIQGTWTYSNLWRTAWIINTWTTLSRSNITNPLNASWIYLLTRNTWFSNLRGNFPWWLNIQSITYSIWWNTLLQTQPVKRNSWNTWLQYYGLSGTSTSTGSYDRYPSQYIWSNINAISWYLNWTTNYTTNTWTITITFSATTNVNYILSGNFQWSPRIWTINWSLSTWILLTTGDWIKTIILQLSTWNARATHYGLTTILDTTLPNFTGTTTSGTIVISWSYYNTTGIAFQFSDANLSWATLNGTTYTGTQITQEGTHTFRVYDLAGNSTGTTFTIDRTSPIITGTGNGAPVTSWSLNYAPDITLSISDTNLSWATRQLTWWTPTPITSYPHIITLTEVNEWQFTIIATDKAGNTTNLTFTGIYLFSPTITLTWTTGTNLYTRSSITLNLTTNRALTTYSITGDFTNNGGILTWWVLIGQNIILTWTNWTKPINVFVQETKRWQFTGRTFSVYFDNQGPAVTLISPINDIAISGDINLSRTAIDTGAGAGIGLSKYFVLLSQTGTFASSMKSWRVSTTTTGFSWYNFANSGTYYWYVQGVDALGNTWAIATGQFNYTATIDSEPDAFDLWSKTDANFNTTYKSNTITVAWITQNAQVLASITNGVLFISGVVVGKTGYVTLGSTVYVELMSSNNNNERVSSTLTIGNQSSQFRVTTAENGGYTWTLSDTSKLNVATVFNTISDLYKDNKSKQIEFMATFNAMLKDQINILEDNNSLTSSQRNKLAILKYLSTLIQKFLDDNNISVTDLHTAPNGKRYVISYDDTKRCYYSRNFQNPAKCFGNIDAIKSYINTNNQKRSHTVDTTRSMADYTAPNGKVYRIQKTTDGKYYSYKFIGPKYFNTLTEIKSYIDKRNPRR